MNQGEKWNKKMGGRSCFITSGAFRHGLPCRLQAQTLPDATPQIDKIHPFCKIPITHEPVMQGEYCYVRL